MKTKQKGRKKKKGKKELKALSLSDHGPCVPVGKIPHINNTISVILKIPLGFVRPAFITDGVWISGAILRISL